MILIIDNYDSFSYNLYQLIGSLESDVKVIRNDELNVRQIEILNPKLIVVAPGPGKPKDAGICVEAIKYFAGNIPIFGVCLGHQAICEAFGGEIGYADRVMHGKTSIIELDNDSILFSNLPKRIKAARYHSLCVKEKNLPNDLKITAKSDDGEIMALERRESKIYGVQFHPESIMTPFGEKIMQNILKTISI